MLASGLFDCYNMIMNDDERKPRLHIHTGGLIIFIIIILILFKVDIKSKIQSPQFQKNISYIEEKAKEIWNDYIISPIKSKTVDFLKTSADKEIEKLQNNISNNLFKTPDLENLDRGLNKKP
jgi:hypothetical protein